MPVASERVPNRSLSTTELRQLLVADFTRLLDNISLLGSCTSFARISWDIQLSLHGDSGIDQTTKTGLKSRPVAHNIISGGKLDEQRRPMPPRPELAVVGDMPLPSPSPVARFESRLLSRDIDSPNAERLRAGLPVPIERRQNDGTTIVENVEYPPDETLGEGAVAVANVSQIAAMALGVAGQPKMPVDASPPDDAQESAVEFKARIEREAQAIEAQAIEDARLAALKPKEVVAVAVAGEGAGAGEDASLESGLVRVRTTYADGKVKVE
jgi:hypothetical protein